MSKIIIATDAFFPQINGVVTTLDNTKKELEKRGHEVYIICPSSFYTVKCPIYKEIDLSFPTMKSIEKIIDNFNPDFVHIATEWGIGIQTRRVLLSRNQQWSSSFHTRFPEYMEEKFGFGKELVWRAMRKIYRNDSVILSTTETMKNIMTENGLNSNKIKVWSRGVDENLVRRNLHIQGNRPVLLNVGRVSVEKNLEDFYKLDIDARKIQVGSGPMLDIYKEKYPSVEFVGPKKGTELFEYYANADAFIFPSKSDTFGLVMIEAMRCGLPVAAYPVPGPIDVIDENITGIMDVNLLKATKKALSMDKDIIFNSSKKYSWKNATDIFENNLVPLNK